MQQFYKELSRTWTDKNKTWSSNIITRKGLSEWVTSIVTRLIAKHWDYWSVPEPFSIKPLGYSSCTIWRCRQSIRRSQGWAGKTFLKGRTLEFIPTLLNAYSLIPKLIFLSQSNCTYRLFLELLPLLGTDLMLAF